MAILITVGLFLVLLVTILYAGYRFYARPGRVYEQLGGHATFTMPELDRINDTEPGLLVTVMKQIGEKMPIDPADATAIRRDLIAAGYRSDRALSIYMGTRVIGCVLFAILALVFRPVLTSNPVLSVVIPVGAGALGYFGPSFVLDFLIGKRQERVRWGLPDALDLLVVSVEAGLGLDQAIQHVARELVTVHPDVSEELELVNLEIRGGQRRVDALRNLAERTGEPELRKLVAIMVQTDRFGTSIADSLRTHSDFMRTRRRQEAEERANKVGVKLVFPIFFLIMPSMLVVAAGPGLLQVFKTLIPMMSNFRGVGI